MLSTNEILTGLGLVIVLAIGCQLVASRLRIPAIVLLLPVGFAAGAITDDVDPSNLLGATFQPLVSLGVGLILFEAGLRLDWSEIRDGARSAVTRLLGLAGAGAPTILVVGGQPWALAICRSLKSAGVGVRIWTGDADEQRAAREAGLDAGNARLGVDQR